MLDNIIEKISVDKIMELVEIYKILNIVKNNEKYRKMFYNHFSVKLNLVDKYIFINQYNSIVSLTNSLLKMSRNQITFNKCDAVTKYFLLFDNVYLNFFGNAINSVETLC